MFLLPYWLLQLSPAQVNLSKSRMRLKWGVGHLVSEVPTATVLPLFHLGMDGVQPNHAQGESPFVPRPAGKRVTVCVGEPIKGLKVKLFPPPKKGKNIYIFQIAGYCSGRVRRCEEAESGDGRYTSRAEVKILFKKISAAGHFL